MNFVDFTLVGMLAPVDIATFSCFNHPASRMLGFRGNPAPWPLGKNFLMNLEQTIIEYDSRFMKTL
jgi:hypothetical protein